MSIRSNRLKFILKNVHYSDFFICDSNSLLIQQAIQIGVFTVSLSCGSFWAQHNQCTQSGRNRSRKQIGNSYFFNSD